ncbi:oxidoreductase [Salpingoeca rosetta]|uniref:Oxidoreductase n=1 Tax=Salpingoeca rosetta (strain ATCC 50818 / BSB-021) TaxID=946362 RepID=F2U925_SALR5|nr:oxidoreductase [Salpingoeca rosetta]EGD73228.1 oxidoreductase [Salpingoeca rosetta]|eukprot:XP_004994259.1 oxidoreductase [Salpingoeca rosetta]
MAQRFSGQVAVVTGGASGIGRAVCERLGKEGATICIFDVKDDAMQETADALASQHDIKHVSCHKVDVACEESVKAALAAVEAAHGRLDIMINCAGIVGPHGVKIEDVEGDAFDRVLAVNLRGSFNMTKHCLPLMSKHDYGRILLIASIAGKDGNAGMCAYSTSKAGVIGLAKAVGKEYAETNITVNALAPAVIRTAMVAGMKPEQIKYMTDKIPMKRCGLLQEVAATVAFIVSKEASFNTGFCFDLSGGRAVY